MLSTTASGWTRQGVCTRKPVKLPASLKAGPPSNGGRTLRSDARGLEARRRSPITRYDRPGEPSLSEYTQDMEPAGTFDDLTQDINWYPDANDATRVSRFEGAAFAYLFASGAVRQYRASSRRWT